MESYVLDELLRHPRYAPVQFLKRGAFGCVLLAQDKATGKLVALKVIKRQEGDDCFVMSEVLNHMRLHHPHVIPLLEMYTVVDHVVLVMEYAVGGDLAGYVPVGRGLDESTACWLFQQIMFALHFCHEMGVASRDIKLQNVLVVSEVEGRPIVKLADFGLSSSCAQDAQLWMPGMPQSLSSGGNTVGTPGYMAPEVVGSAGRGEERRAYDAKAADVWSSGVLLYSLLTGTLPFQREQDLALEKGQRLKVMMARIQQGRYRMPPGVSQECRDLLQGMLRTDPSRRPTAAQVLTHPWCSQGVDAQVVLDANLAQLEASLATPPSTQLVTDVLGLLYGCSNTSQASPSSSSSQHSSPRAPDSPSQAWEYPATWSAARSCMLPAC